MTTETLPDVGTAAGFLSERHDFLYVYATRSEGDGWDVVMRIDGTYADRVDAEDAAEGMRAWIDSLEDIRKDGRHWWDGPPWKTSR